MPKIDIAKLPVDSRSTYPEPFTRVVAGRSRKRLGVAAGLDQFGVNLTTLTPGAASALRHWHHKEDELVYVLEGEILKSHSRLPSRPFTPRPSGRGRVYFG